MVAPPGLEAVVDASGRIEPWKLDEARQVWGATSRHVRANPGDTAAAERLYFLTLALSNVLVSARNDLGLRALHEGALEVLPLPRHRQVIRGHLARGAAKAGDLDSARGWLEGCDPASSELEMDSAFRISQAFIATATGDANALGHLLGADEATVPIVDSMDPIAIVLRAHAFERLGNLAGASATLSRFMSSRGGTAAVIETIVASLPPAWGVCAQSLAGARQDHRQQLAARAAGGAGVFGWAFLIAGLLPAGLLLPLHFATGELPLSLALLFSGLSLVPFGGVGLSSIRTARRQRLVAESGLSGRGRVVQVASTGVKVNHVPMMRVVVQTSVPGHPSLQASVTKRMSPHLAAELMGQELPIVWHPAYPDDVVLEI